MPTLTIPALAISGILAIIMGIIILIWPRSLNIAVAIYLIVVGIIQLIGGFY